MICHHRDRSASSENTEQQSKRAGWALKLYKMKRVSETRTDCPFDVQLELQLGKIGYGIKVISEESYESFKSWWFRPIPLESISIDDTTPFCQRIMSEEQDEGDL